MYKDRLDQSWRLSGYGKRFSESWRSHTNQGTAEKVVRCACRAVDLGSGEAVKFQASMSERECGE